jgi:hypothetical protein
VYLLGPARKNINAKNLEDALKSLKVMLKDSKKRRSQLEETVIDLKKEVKKTSDKMSSQLDSKLKVAEDWKRDANTQIAVLNKANAELVDRLSLEKEGKASLNAEIESLQKQNKKINEHLKELQRERESLLSVSRQKDREIAFLKMNKPSSGSGRVSSSGAAAGSGEGTDAGDLVVPAAVQISSMLKTSPAAALNSSGAKTQNGKSPADAAGVWSGQAALTPNGASAKFFNSDGDEFIENTADLGEHNDTAASNSSSKMPPPSSLPVRISKSRDSQGSLAKDTKAATRIPQSHERSYERVSVSTPATASASAGSTPGSTSAVSTSKQTRTSTTLASSRSVLATAGSKAAMGATTATSRSGVSAKPVSAASSHRNLNSGLFLNADSAKRRPSSSAADSGSATSPALGAKHNGTINPASVAAARQNIAQRSKEALLKHQVSRVNDSECLFVVLMQ